MTGKNFPDLYDICIIGGGINGAGIARDAAGRGLSVLLLEQGDLAQATSSASTKLIHGGLRYLEYYEFKLVRESLKERSVLLKLAPHIIWPLVFVLPHQSAIRPYWMVRAGLFLYDALAGRSSLPSSRGISLTQGQYGSPLLSKFRKGFSYADCWVEDARLVVLNAMSAREKGARIETRRRCTSAQPVAGEWRIESCSESGETQTFHSRMLINTAGPWVRQFLDANHLAGADTPAVRLVQGSHIIVPRLYDGNHAYILQQRDGRIVFAIPYEGKFTLIGTTETEYQGDPLRADITAAEINYLLDAANTVFCRTVNLSDIVRTYSGVRPLFDDHSKEAKAVTRDYYLHTSEHDGACLLSVFGGKITTYRKLAEQATTIISDQLSRPNHSWTHREALPGGEFSDFFNFLEEKKIRYPDCDSSLLRRYARAYGTRMDAILNMPQGCHYGDGIYEAEIRYLIRHEFARTVDDILWRRSKLGLHASAETIALLTEKLPGLLEAMHD